MSCTSMKYKRCLTKKPRKNTRKMTSLLCLFKSKSPPSPLYNGALETPLTRTSVITTTLTSVPEEFFVVRSARISSDTNATRESEEGTTPPLVPILHRSTVQSRISADTTESVAVLSGRPVSKKSQSTTKSIRRIQSAESGRSTAQKSQSTTKSIRRLLSTESAASCTSGPRLVSAESGCSTAQNSQTTTKSIRRLVSAESGTSSTQKSRSNAKSIRRLLSAESAASGTSSIQKSRTTLRSNPRVISAESGSSTTQKSRTTTKSMPDALFVKSVASHSSIISAAAPHSSVKPPPPAKSTPSPPAHDYRITPPSPTDRTVPAGGTSHHMHPSTSSPPAPTSHTRHYSAQMDDLIYSDVFRRLASQHPNTREHTGPPRLGSPSSHAPASLSYDIRPPARQPVLSKRDVGHGPVAAPALSGSLSSHSRSLYLVSHPTAPPGKVARTAMDARYVHQADVFRNLIPPGR
eukprot:GEMP01016060.1.p1 GENE.GEMP01016060.1~~GEMP01016060.1.p1  ORF type:complete len:464 (+),score=52.94 GEMP01016060.1:395-1786(+)